MKLWLSRTSGVPLQEQLSTQLVLGIVSADLAPGERLPSTSQLARRFHVHPNTVRAAYRELAQRGWVEWRRGSGFYVRALAAEAKLGAEADLDRLTATFLTTARDRGYSLSEIQSRITRWFSLQPPDRVLVIEPDSDLREILIAEIEESVSLPVAGASLEDCAKGGKWFGALCVALYDHAEEVRGILPPEASCLLLHSRSIARTLARESRPPRDALITVVSRWEDFLQWARTTLVAVGIDPIALDLRDASQKGWSRGLTGRGFLITDSVVARRLPKGCLPRVFRIIADGSMAELRQKLARQE